MATWNDLKETAMNLTQAGMSKAKEVGEIAKLNIENVSAEENIKRAYTEIGKLYVALHTADPESQYDDMFEKIQASREKIQANKARIAKIKADNNLSDDDVASEEETIEAEVIEQED
ncbi:MAG: serine proteinase [Evtepia sp.]